MEETTMQIIEDLEQSARFDFAGATDEQVAAEVAARLLKSGAYSRPEIAAHAGAMAVTEWNRRWVARNVEQDELMAGPHFWENEALDPLG